MQDAAGRKCLLLLDAALRHLNQAPCKLRPRDLFRKRALIAWPVILFPRQIKGARAAGQVLDRQTRTSGIFSLEEPCRNQSSASREKRYHT